MFRVMMFLLGLMMLPQLAHSSVYVVDPGGGGDFLTIQAAINAAQSGDEIQVMPATYLENLDLLGRNLWIHSITGPDDTIIDGSQGMPDHASCLLLVNGESLATTLQGFTFTGGEGTYSPDYQTVVGGAIYCHTAGATVRECRFATNTALNGAAVFFRQGQLEFIDCTFENNISASYGGAISGEIGYLHVQDCGFTANTAQTGDGAISVASGVDLLVEGSSFEENAARAGGGINVGAPCPSSVIRGCTFHGNSATGLHGGGIRIHETQTIVEDCVFWDNHSVLDGGGLIVLEGSAIVRSCTFEGNHALRQGSGIEVFGGSADIGRTVITGGMGPAGVFVEGSADFWCCDVWGNEGGNFVGIPDPTGTQGNISLDPFYCDPQAGDFTLRADSPCAPFTPPNPECDLTGALPVNCPAPVPVVESTWGGLKARYRD